MCAPGGPALSSFPTAGHMPPPLVPYLTLRPHSTRDVASLWEVAQVAAKDSSCPSCRHAAAATRLWQPTATAIATTTMTGESLVRAGVTRDGRLPQPMCPGSKTLQQIDAPPFIAAEWPRRLIEANAPFGLRMGGKTEEQMLARVRAFLRNASQPLRCRYATCAVVGSGGSLRGARLGAAIDAHEAVVRLNAAPTAGHEERVGTRTTWRVHNSEKPWFMASLNTPELQLVVCHTAWIGACQHQAFSGLYSQNASVINPRFYSQLWGLLGRPRGKQTPSTGLLAIAVALTSCDSVSIFGFSKPGEAAARCSHHYWECPSWARNRQYLDPKHQFHAVRA